PTVLMRKECYDRLGLYDNRFRQLPDYDMWIRVVKNYEINISEREIVNFRVLPGENASSPTPSNSVRSINELFLIAHEFFNNVSIERFRQGFSDLCLLPPTDALDLEVEKANVLTRGKGPIGEIFAVVGLRRLHELLNCPEYKASLARRGMDELWFHNLTSKIGTLTHGISL